MKDDQIESVWAGMREKKLERKVRKWYREYLVSPDMFNWLTWEEYKNMRRKFNKKVFTWEEVVTYKKRIEAERIETEKFECPNCNTISEGDATECVLCGWTKP